MTREHWARIKALFHAVREMPESRRGAFLGDACEMDARMREDLDHLLGMRTDLKSPVAEILRDSTPVLTANSVLGHYRVEEELGRGGMGAVYRAYDTQLLRPVALKVLPAEYRSAPQRRERLLREARAASALAHPNIVAIYEVGSDAGIDFIAMELADGQPLEKLIPPSGMPLGQALNYAVQIADGLARAHASGVIHRDLKPRNIMVSRGSGAALVKLLDFGLAKLLTISEAEDTSLTVDGEILGTPAYMSPEQAQGKPVDTRSDIFSFGAVLYQMLAGRRAFSGDSVIAVLSAVLKEDPPRLAGVPPELDALVTRCLRKDPAKRMQHMDDVRIILEDIRTETAQTVAPKTSKPKRWPLMAGALAILIAAAGLISIRAVRPRSEGGQLRLAPLTSYPGVETAPSFSPDGRQVAFAWNGEKQGDFDIYVTLVGPGAAPLRLTTDPADDVSPAWSTDGRQIAFLRLQQQVAGIYLISPLGNQERKLSDLRQTSIDPNQTPPTLSWSPDGNWLAVPDEDAARERGIFAVPTGARERHRLTSNRLDFDYSPAFSPDGRFLAYASCRDTYSCDVFVLELGAGCVPVGQPRQVTHQGLYVGGIAWTQNGDALVYEASGDAGISPHLWRVAAFAAGASERMELSGQPSRLPAIARVGERLAYSRGGEDLDVWKYEPRDGVKGFISSTLYEYNPSYSPDGGRIAFSSNRSGTMEVWVCNPDGSNVVQLTEGPGRHQGGPQWSPDGRWIAFSSLGENGDWAVFVMDSGGGTPRRVTPPDISASTVSWSRDGKWLYFAANRTGRLEIWRIPVEGGKVAQITDQGGFIAFESSDGKTLYYNKTRRTGINPVYARPLPSGPERIIVDSAVNAAFAVTANGLYYFARGGKRSYELQFQDFAAREMRTLTQVEIIPHWRMAVSPGATTILFGAAKPASADLVLIENFR
jgi:eukaryotic-like serine/threonine-protein kinase